MTINKLTEKVKFLDELNKINEVIDELNNGVSIVIDSELNESSPNPVQNAVITSALNLKQDTLTAGIGISISAEGVISNTQTSAEWGNIQGDLSEQTDLMGILDLKQDLLTAGTNISISQGIISAKPYIAGNGISIDSNNVVSTNNYSYTELSPAFTPENGVVTWTVNHNLNTRNLICSLYSGDIEIAKNITINSANSLTISFKSNTSSVAETYKVVILANGGSFFTSPIGDTWIPYNGGQNVINDETVEAGSDYECDVSSYLPDDDEQYEVLFQMSVGYGNLVVYTSEFSFLGGTYATNTTARTQVVVPVGADRLIKLHAYTKSMTVYANIAGYRKVINNKLLSGSSLESLANTSLSNITTTAQEKINNLFTPSTDITKIKPVTLGADRATYTAPCNGWLRCNILTTASSAMLAVYSADIWDQRLYYAQIGDTNELFFVSKGDYVIAYNNVQNHNGIYFVPCKGEEHLITT